MEVVVIGDRAVAAADHAGDGDRAGGIGDHQIRRRERILFVVQRDDAVRPRGPDGA